MLTNILIAVLVLIIIGQALREARRREQWIMLLASRDIEIASLKKQLADPHEDRDPDGYDLGIPYWNDTPT